VEAKETREILKEIKGAKMTPGVCIICPWHCATEVYTRAGEVIYVRGNELSPNRGTRCVKGIASIHLAKDPNRLLHPMKKNKKGGFDRISWKDAFSLIAEKLQKIKNQDGPEAVVFLLNYMALPTVLAMRPPVTKIGA
jgi:thiosulfate reductase/polysulfide reductase chain A